MKIVEFPDGTYGIEKGWIFKRYLCRYTNSWWKDLENVFQFCRYGDVEHAKRRIECYLAWRKRKFKEVWDESKS